MKSRWACCLVTAALALAGMGVVCPAGAQELPVDLYEEATQATMTGDESEVLRTDGGNIAEGTWGTCPWEITADGVLRILPGEGYSGSPWSSYADQVTSVSVLPQAGNMVIAPECCDGLFDNLYRVQSMNLTGLDVSSARSMRSMFSSSNLRELITSGWNTSNVENMSAMFYNCTHLESVDLAGWKTSKVTDMSYMFHGCTSLVAPDASNWNVSSVTDMEGMFGGCSGLTSLDLTKWNVSSVTNMEGMFGGCSSLTSLDLTKWNVSSVTNMEDMFEGCSSLASFRALGWNASSLVNACGMFDGCSSLTSLDFSDWNVSSVTNMSYMFNRCTSLTSLRVRGWDTSKVTTMGVMFNECSSLTTLDLSGWDTSLVESVSYMFCDCSSLTTLDLSGWDTSSVMGTGGMFWGCSSLSSISVGTKYKIVDDYMFPSATAANGKWWSTAASRWYTMEEIVGGRSKVADTYRNAGDKTDISAATIEAIPSKAYTGSPIKPKPTVTLDGTELTYGTDYGLSWNNNTDVGTATVTVRGKGDYTGAKEATFEVVARSVSSAEVTFEPDPCTFTGSAIEPSATVTVKGRELVPGRDYDLAYKGNVDAGTATVTVRGKGNYKGTARGSFSIAPASLSEATIAWVEEPLVYTGEPFKPSFAITFNGLALVEGIDYTVSCANNVNAGNATVTLRGRGNFEGALTSTLKIAARSVSEATVTLAKTSYTYTGGSVKPGVTVTIGEATLTKGTDYTVSYQDNVNAGTATVTVKGTGNYTGTKKATFTIKPKSLAKAEVTLATTSYTYSGSPKRPKVASAKLGTTELKAGNDYAVSYEDNVDAGTAIVTVTGKGNYKGAASATFTIKAKSLAKAEVTLATTSYTFSGSAKKPKVTSVKLGTTELKAVTDYTVSYEDNTNAGTAIVTVTGKGNYKGTATATFTIKAKSLKDATVTPEKAYYAYTGKALRPPVTVKLGTKDLTEGEDYTVTYKDNVEVGVAAVTVRGTGNYKGTATGTFKVVPARPALSKVTPGTGYLRAYWKAASVGGAIDGWQVQRATDSSFKQDPKTYKVADPAATSKKISGLTSGTTYYVRVRTYKVVGGKTYHSSWSTVKSATAK